MSETTRFDPAIYLDDDETQDELMREAVATGDQAAVSHATATIARAGALTCIPSDQ